MAKKRKLKFDLDINLYGPLGNVFCVMGMWERAAWDNGWTKEQTDEVLKEAKRGNYAYVIQTLNKYLIEEMVLPKSQGEPEVYK